jgi:hypothetical protein
MPDGLPVLDRAAPYDDVHLATGCSMRGVTPAAPAGRAQALCEPGAVGQEDMIIDPTASLAAR